MTPLDGLYGKGASAKFAKRIPGEPEITETQVSRKEVRVDVAWPDGSVCKLSCRASKIHWLTLRSETPGLYSDMVKHMLAMFKSWGIRTFTASPQNATSAKILRKRGKWRPQKAGTLIWHL